MARRQTRKRASRSTGELQKMGGKEERVSSVGRERQRVEEREARGEARFDIDPGPGSEDLLLGPKGVRSARPGRKVSRKPRAEPGRIEPEDRTTSRQSDALERKLKRQPGEQLPRDPGEPPAAGEVPD